MRVLPVLDVQGGLVVRGIAGRRREYRPNVSQLTSSAHPVEVAEAFRSLFNLSHLYLADLDAIAGAAPALSIFHNLAARGFHLWVDAGIRDVDDSTLLAETGIAGVVVGLETVRGPNALAEILRRFGPERIVFSLDLKEGAALGNTASWDGPDAETIAAQAVRLGVRHLIALDLARVGMGSGIGTEALCRQLATAHPRVEIVAGGGVKDAADLRQLREAGVGGALVASALHDGRIRREDLEEILNLPGDSAAL